MIRNFPVTVTDVNEFGKSETKSMYLKPHWSVNAAQRPLATLETKLMSALAQAQASSVLKRKEV